MVVVHHNRKIRSGDDPMADVSGSYGVVGTADTIWTVRKMQRYNNRAMMYVSGRDVVQQQLTMEYNDGVWTLIGDDTQDVAGKEQVPQVIYHIIDHVIMCKKWIGTSSELLEEIGETSTKPNEIGKLLVRYANTVLAEAGITYSQIRRTTQRTIVLEYIGDELGE